VYSAGRKSEKDAPEKGWIFVLFVQNRSTKIPDAPRKQ
jgi:hypothetical protein